MGYIDRYLPARITASWITSAPRSVEQGLVGVTIIAEI